MNFYWIRIWLPLMWNQRLQWQSVIETHLPFLNDVEKQFAWLQRGVCPSWKIRKCAAASWFCLSPWGVPPPRMIWSTDSENFSPRPLIWSVSAVWRRSTSREKVSVLMQRLSYLTETVLSRVVRTASFLGSWFWDSFNFREWFLLEFVTYQIQINGGK